MTCKDKIAKLKKDTIDDLERRIATEKAIAEVKLQKKIYKLRKQSNEEIKIEAQKIAKEQRQAYKKHKKIIDKDCDKEEKKRR